MQRFATVFLGFILAIVAGALVLMAINGYWSAQTYSHSLSHYNDEWAFESSMMVAPLFTLVSAAIAVVVGEMAHIRSALYYIVAGGVAAVVIPFFTSSTLEYQSITPYFSVIATAGFAGGLIYWLFAGRSA